MAGFSDERHISRIDPELRRSPSSTRSHQCAEDHARCRAALEKAGHRLIIPTLVIAEAAYLIGTRLGPDVEAQFLDSMTRMHVEAPAPDDWPRIADLVKQYGDFPFGGVDASIVVLAERLDIETVVTLDDRHFRAVRPRHRKAFRLLP